MTLPVLLVLAQRTSDTQAPDTGSGIALIVGTLVAIVLVLAVAFLVISRRAKASRGGVEPAPGSREQGAAPFESIERDR